VEKHCYSVPHRFVRAEVEVRFTARTVEIFHKGERIAAHARMSGNHKHTTVPEHMASSHRRYAGWTIERIRRDAAALGPATSALCNLILDERPHPEQGFRACLGILRLAASYGRERLDAAAARAIDIGARNYGSVKSILANNLDRRPAPIKPTSRRCPSAWQHNPAEAPLIDAENLFRQPGPPQCVPCVLDESGNGSPERFQGSATDPAAGLSLRPPTAHGKGRPTGRV
jgi:hypothetical protein